MFNTYYNYIRYNEKLYTSKPHYKCSYPGCTVEAHTYVSLNNIVFQVVRHKFLLSARLSSCPLGFPHTCTLYFKQYLHWAAGCVQYVIRSAITLTHNNFGKNYQYSCSVTSQPLIYSCSATPMTLQTPANPLESLSQQAAYSHNFCKQDNNTHKQTYLISIKGGEVK